MNRANRTARVTALAVALVLVVACASAPPDRVALDTLQTMKATADSAMRVCANLYSQGRHYDPASKTWSVVDPSRVVFTDEQKAKSIEFYDKFAAAAITAATALKTVTNEGDAAAVIADATAALASLLETLRTFGVKV